jgi:hypothetical protein
MLSSVVDRAGKGAPTRAGLSVIRDRAQQLDETKVLVKVEPMTGIEPAYSVWKAFLRPNG